MQYKLGPQQACPMIDLLTTSMNAVTPILHLEQDGLTHIQLMLSVYLPYIKMMCEYIYFTKPILSTLI